MIYLDNAATAMKKPQRVRDALISSIESGNPGRGSHSASLAASEMIYGARCDLAALFKANAENVIFTCGATASLNTAIKGICQRGQIITTDFEHNSVRRPVLATCRERGCSWATIPSACRENMAATLWEMTKKETTAVVCIHKSNITGRTMPIGQLGEVCRRRGIPFIVDASQSAGNTSIDMERDNIDVLCAAGHKGLMGIQGVGILIARNGVEIAPLLHGGSGSDPIDEDMPPHLPDRLEAGTPPTPAIASLGAGARFVLEHGADRIGRKEERLWLRCRDKLHGMPRIRIYDGDMPGANLLFNIEGISPSQVARELDSRGICVRSGLHCAPDAHAALGSSGAVRASFGYYTTTAEIDEFIKCIRSIVFP